MLQALVEFDEVLVFDNGSTDSTVEIAKQFENTRICKGTFKGFGKTHNEASTLAKHDWILSVDSDEVLTPELVKEIQAITLNENCVYAISRHNEYNKKFIKWCGWHPDFQVRLYNKKKTAFSDASVHEAVITSNSTVIKLKQPMRHYSYGTVSDFLAKMQSYSDLFALQNCGKKSSSPFKAIAHAVFAFFKSYIIKKGFLGGYEGFLISSYNSHTAFYKYIKLYEANQRSKCSIEARTLRCPEDKAANLSCPSDSH